MSKAERTRRLIIEKTAHIFNAKGYSGTSINDVMEATGLTKGCIYGNFQNKDEIALAAFDHNFGQVTAFIRSKILEKDTVIAKLLVYPEIYKDFLNVPFINGGCPVLNTSTEADDTHPMLKERAEAALRFWQASIAKMIAHGIESGELKASANAQEFAVVMTSLIEGSVMQAKLTGSSEGLEIAMRFLGQMIRELQA